MNTLSIVDAVFSGPVRPLERLGFSAVPSGIVKWPQNGPVKLTRLGIEGDEQGDRLYHGGPEKALHHYASEHYALWRSMYPDSPLALAPGAFGENIATTGMTEHTVCIGDIYTVGSCVVQVAQGRQPCWKLNRRLDRPDAALTMQTVLMTGWYYRVLREGTLEAGDALALNERPLPAWPLARLLRALFPLDAAEPGLADEWARAAQLAPLAQGWRTTFGKRAASGALEDWTARLHEP